jgi:segregation and condensation protein B
VSVTEVNEVVELDDDALSGAIEALLLMATEPVPAVELAQALCAPVVRVEAALAALVRFYIETRRGFELRHAGGGWRYATRPEFAGIVSAYVLDGQHGKLSQAALETLAVIAYLQPSSRSRISAVRGVNVDGVVRTLLARDLIAESGRDPVSGAVLFTTTPYFLERMGLRSIDDLPPLAPHLPDASTLEAELLAAAQPVNPTATEAEDDIDPE